MASICAISSAVSFQLMALAFCSICSVLDAPAITFDTRDRVLAETVFPDSGAVKAIQGLVV